MSRPPHLGRVVLLLITFGLTGAIFAAREASHDAADGLALLYLLPVALVSLEFGVVAGLAVAAAALGLVGLWDATSSSVTLSVVGYVARAVLFFGAAWLCAAMARRLRRVARDGDRYFELGDDMICVGSLDGHFVRVNSRWTDVLGWSEEELIGRSLAEIVHPDDLDALEAEMGDARGGAVTADFVCRVRTRDGDYRYLEWSATPDVDEGLAYAAARDVTERRRNEAELQLAQERFRAAFDDSAAGMAVVGLLGDEAGRVVETNQAIADILGVPREEMIGTFTFAAYAHPDDVPELAEQTEALVAGDIPVLDTELRVVRPGGEVRWVQVRASILHDADGVARYRLSQVIDIHELKDNQEKLRHVADHDPLSWLFNRRRFMADLENEVRAHATHGSRAAVLMIDLDDFKQVNDEAGHAAGDEVIRTVALAMVRRLRSGDIAGRLGGDEFGVVLRRVDPDQARLVADELLEAVQRELAELATQAARNVTLSIGLAMLDGARQGDADDLIALADHAMYDAKAAGGGRVVVAPDERSARR